MAMVSMLRKSPVMAPSLPSPARGEGFPAAPLAPPSPAHGEGGGGGATFSLVSSQKASAQTSIQSKAWTTAVDFEAQFLKTMLEEAYSGLSGEGPLGGEGHGAEAWRSFLIDAQAKGMAGRAGLGIAEAVYRDTIRRMEKQNG